MICPKCGCNQVTSQVITNTTTTNKTKSFGCFKACIGFLLFDIPGILCGLCGMGKGKTKITSTQSVVHVCQNCGYHF